MRERGHLVLTALLACGCGVARPVDGRRCSPPESCVSVHAPGIADPASPAFHGALVRSLGYDFAVCAQCHGEDFAGGRSGKSCLVCHEGGPTGCATCHGSPPASGAHARHAARGVACGECHVVPARWDEPGHLRDAAGQLRTSAAVSFGPLARSGPVAPAWHGARCSDTYCHGAARPAWNGGRAEAACGSCHGVPPAGHQSRRCGDCHGRVADDSAKVVGVELHVDGKLSLGDDSGSCGACHPTLGGAHAAHTGAPHQLRAPLVCGDCHVTPTAVDSPGHIDHAPGAAVFPEGTSALARSDGAAPSWDAAAGRCADVYCHGGGRALGGDATPGLARQPAWSGGSAVAVCGACHGVPPRDAAHDAGLGLGDCSRCHARTVDATGALIRGGAHLDGVIDAL